MFGRKWWGFACGRAHENENSEGAKVSQLTVASGRGHPGRGWTGGAENEAVFDDGFTISR